MHQNKLRDQLLVQIDQGDLIHTILIHFILFHKIILMKIMKMKMKMMIMRMNNNNTMGDSIKDN